MASPGRNCSFPKICGRINTSLLVDQPKYMFGCFFNVEFGYFLIVGPFNSFKITIMKTNNNKP